MAYENIRAEDPYRGYLGSSLCFFKRIVDIEVTIIAWISIVDHMVSGVW